MTSKNKLRSLAVHIPLAICTAAMSAPSFADYASYISKPPTVTPLGDRIEIPSDGGQYLPANGATTISTPVRLRLDANTLGRIKSWALYFKTRAVMPNGFVEEFKRHPNSASESYPVGSRPKEIELERFLSLDYHDAPVYCNQYADYLRTEGYSDVEIFTQDRIFPLQVRVGLDYEFSGPEGFFPWVTPEYLGDGYEERYFDIVCKAYNPDPQRDVGGDPIRQTGQKARITYANLALAHDSEPTECPAPVTAQVLFAANTQGTFSFRFKNVWQQVSQPIELTMGPENFNGIQYTKVFNHQFLVGEPEEDGMAQGRGEDSAVGEGKISPPLEIGGGHSLAGGGGGLVVVEGDDNEYTDSLWVEILSAASGSVEETDHESYNVTCADDGSGAVIQPQVDGKAYYIPEERIF